MLTEKSKVRVCACFFYGFMLKKNISRWTLYTEAYISFFAIYFNFLLKNQSSFPIIIFKWEKCKSYVKLLAHTYFLKVNIIILICWLATNRKEKLCSFYIVRSDRSLVRYVHFLTNILSIHCKYMNTKVSKSIKRLTAFNTVFFLNS